MFNFLTNIFIPKNTTPAKKREFVGKFAGISGIVLNGFLCVFKAITGVLAGSVAVIADAVNNLSDALSSVITVISFKFSGKPADKDHPYGHERIEYVITLFLAFFIMFIGYEFIKTSVDRIIHPASTDISVLTVVVLVVAVAVKLFMYGMYLHYSRSIDSTVLKATAQDSLNDAIATGAILLAGILSKLLDLPLDGYVSLGVSLLIIWSAIGLIKDAMDPLLGTPPDREFVKKLGDKIKSYDGVIGIHDLIVHSYGPNKTFASVHAEVDAKGDILHSHDLIDNIEREVSGEFSLELVIHMDPIITSDEAVDNARNTVMEIVSGIDNILTIHDFRMVPGNTHTNLIFDVVLPFKFNYSPEELLDKVSSEVKERMGEQYYCVVNFDRDYNGNM